MKVTPVLWKYHNRKDKLFPVKIRVTNTQFKKTTVEYINLGFSIERGQWSNTERRVKKHPNMQEYNSKIVKTMAEYELGKVSGSNDVYWWLQEYIDHAKLKHGFYYHRRLVTLKNTLKAFRAEILVPHLTPKFVVDFEKHMIGEGMHPNYIADTFKRFRAVVRTIEDNGLLEHHKNPLNNYKPKTVERKRDRLTIADIEKLEASKIDSLARDMYIFSFYCGGIRFGDLCRLKPANFDKGRLHYTMSKTTTSKNIKLHPTALRIIKKYKYQFPTLVNWSDEEKSINIRNAFYNRKLKQACDLAGVKKVSFHTSRHSIADYAIKMKLSDQELQGILGHKRSATTQAYKKSIYQEETDAAMDKLFG